MSFIWLKTRENESVLNRRRAGPLVIGFLFIYLFEKNSQNLITSIEMRIDDNSGYAISGYGI